MVEAWIIEKIQKEKPQAAERPYLELPLELEIFEEKKEEDKKDIMLIQIWGDEDGEEEEA